MSIIGFADAVREAVAKDSDDWTHYGWVVIRRIEPFHPGRRDPVSGRFCPDRATSMLKSRDPITHDYREFLTLRDTFRKAREKAAEEAQERARLLRFEHYGDAA